jgi:Mitochondrial carrier protein
MYKAWRPWKFDGSSRVGRAHTVRSISSGEFVLTTAPLSIHKNARSFVTQQHSFIAGSAKGIIGTAQELLLEPGGLYRGFGLKLLRSVPASMIGFVVYEQVAQRLGAGSTLDTAKE